MTNKDDVFENKEERNDFIIALIVIAVFIVFVFMIYKNGFKEDASINDAVLINNTDVGSTQENSSNQNNESYQSYQSNESNGQLLNSVKSKTNELVSSKSIKDTAPIIIASSASISDNIDKTETNIAINKQETIDALVVKDSALIQNTVLKTPEAVIKDDKTLVESKSEGAEKQNIAETNTVSNTLNTTIQSKESLVEDDNKGLEQKNPNIENADIKTTNNIKNCVIVVGAFREENNLKKALIKLKSNGYIAVQGPINNNGLQYAGAAIDCNEQKAEKRLKMKTLNTIFNVESWVFRKSR